MKKTTILFILFLSCYLKVQSQDWAWAKNFQNNDNSISNDSFIDSNKNIYQIGNFNSSVFSIGTFQFLNSSEAPPNSNVQYTDAYIAKHDANGNLVYVKHFTGSKYESITSITFDGNNNFYITGYYNGTITLGQNTYSTTNPEGQSFMAKFDLSGNLIWSKEINYHGNSILEYKNGFLYLAGVHIGNTYTYDNLITPSANYLAVVENMDKTFIAKLDLSGNAIWIKSSTYNGSANIQSQHRIGTQPKGLSIDSNGNVYIAGFFFSLSTTFGTQTLTKTGSNGSANLYIAKYDSNGDFAWALKPTTSAHTSVSDLKIDSQNNIYLMGNISSSSITFGGNTINFPGNSGTFIAKYTTTGTVSWLKGGKISSDAQPTIGLGMNYFHKMYIDSNDNIHVTGVFSKYINFGNNYTFENADWTSNMFSVKFDSNGNASDFFKIGDVIQSREVKILNMEGDLFYYAGKLADPLLNLGNIVLENSSLTTQSFIAKRQANLNTKEFTKSFSIYPNPAESVVNISNFEENATLKIFDSTGKEIKEQVLSQPYFSIQDLAKGIYILQLENNLNKKHFKLIKK